MSLNCSLKCVCVCVLQDKLKSLGIELDEEKSNVELLNDRIARSREQVHTHTGRQTHTHTPFVTWRGMQSEQEVGLLCHRVKQ